jgi:translation initiation factor 2 alpha subunit (eIF-2alpha)
LEESKINSKELEKFIGKPEAEKVLTILKTQKKKTAVVKKEFSLKTTKPNGLTIIKDILATKEAEITYISAGKYMIKIESGDLKKADQKISEILKIIEEKAKKQKLEFSIK